MLSPQLCAHEAVFTCATVCYGNALVDVLTEKIPEVWCCLMLFRHNTAL